MIKNKHMKQMGKISGKLYEAIDNKNISNIKSRLEPLLVQCVL